MANKEDAALPTGDNSKRKSVDLLPKYFRTDTNEKILSSTIDQLFQPGTAEKVSGYVGRTTAKAYRASDTYIEDVSTQRQNRQFESSTVITDNLNNVNFYGDYSDYVNQIKNLNGDISNQSLLSGQEFYAWNPNIDWDKFVNFRDYYWMPNGPQTVNVFGRNDTEQSEYTVTTEVQDDNTVYKFDPPAFDANPTLTLYKGQTYRFKIRCKGHPISFTTNRKFNDADFKLSQDSDGNYVVVTPSNGEIKSTNIRTSKNSLRVPGTYEITDYVSTENGKFAKFEVIISADGVVSSVSVIEGGENFTSGEVITFFDADLGDGGAPNVRVEVTSTYNNATNVSNRYVDGIKAYDVNNNEILPINVEEGTIEFTVPFNSPENLYYVSSTNINTSGYIKVFDIVENTSIDINDILEKRYYKSANGVELTNGLKVSFLGNVTPSEYANSEYYVEGVGDSIKLIDERNLVIPAAYTGDVFVPFDSEPFDRRPFGNASAYAGTKDYIIINRASLDRNAWTRYNRWFHKDVIEKSAFYNNQQPVVDLSERASRPIIEFEAGLKLFGYGINSKHDVDLIDTVTTDIFSTIEGATGYSIDGVPLSNGMRILVTTDTDVRANNKIYEVNFIKFDNNNIISLVEAKDTNPMLDETVLIKNGSNSGLIYYFNGTNWHLAQDKTQTNQQPLFDLFDHDGSSFSDVIQYPDSTFRGTKIFSYKVSEVEANDKELGFGLSYKNIENLGDILFEFPLITETVQYNLDNEILTYNLEAGFLKKFNSPTEFTYQNGWTKANKNSEQAAILQYIAEGVDNESFNVSVFKNIHESIAVFVNNDITTDYSINKDRELTFEKTLNVDDNIVIKLYSSEAIINGNAYYEMASNFERNPLNENPKEFTLGEVLDHVNTIQENLIDLEQHPLRDYGDIDQYGRRFLKHSGPINLPLFHIVDKDANIVKALRYSKNEYAKFKRQFIQTASTLGFDGPVKVHVDKVLQKINSEKSEGMPFYFSDMLAYKADNRISYKVLPSSSKFFALSEYFNLDALSAKAVLVYVNGIQLTHEKEYVFTDEGFVNIKVELNNGDEIDLYEYETTDGCFIPATPTKLGLYPAYHPKKYTDTTTAINREVIQGHDGSIVVAYGDYRDDLILDFEKRIFNNIKQKYNTDILDINEFVSGTNRDTGFTRQQINSAMSADFVEWNDIAGGLDYSNIDFWSQTNKFTFNFSAMSSPQDQSLPGFWRGVYKEAFDTDRPHTHPWEMLGLTIEPQWWSEVYGPAPYTNSNFVMWEDLQQGIIRDPNAQTIVNSKYVRPGLLNHLPVDAEGNLVDPLTSDYAKNYVQIKTRSQFTFGDHSPIETAWRQSSEYPFALITSWMLNQPAKLMGLGYDISRIKRNLVGHLVYTESNTPIRTTDLVFPNTYNDNTRVLSSGLVNYIYNFLATNIDVTWKKYTQSIASIDNKLAIKVGGFTEKEKFKLILDSRTPLNEGNVFVPEENYQIILNKSAPIDTAVLSGIIVEKRPNGWSIAGYDKQKASFDFYEASAKSTDPVINIGGISEEFVIWNESKQYVKSANVRYDGFYYRCISSHVSGSTFDQDKFAKLSSLPTVGGRDAILRRNFTNVVKNYPYGTTLRTVQELVDFILGYERYLMDQGFVFDYFNKETGVIEDWTYSVKELMFWTTQNWSAGSVLTLSPGAQQFKFYKEYAVVDDIFDKFYNYSLVKADGKLLERNFTSIARDSENQFGLEVKNSEDGIYGVRLPLVQIEHVILLDNETVFNDVIFDRPAGYRQERIKVIGYRSDEWTGGLNIPGFIYDEAIVTEWEQWQDYDVGALVKYKEFYYVAKIDLKGVENFVPQDWERLDKRPTPRLLPNFDYRSIQFADFYDLDSDNFDVEQQKHAQHLIGYQKRQYLSNIINDDVSQYKFYQGFIQDKGTPNALTKLFDALGSDDTDSLEFYEEWALRVGQYGAVDSYEEVEYIIDENEFRVQPQTVELVNSKAINDVDLSIKILPYQVNSKPLDYNHKPFPTVKDYYKEIIDSGYVNEDDITYTVADVKDMLTADVNRISSDEYIWVTGKNEDWDILQHVVSGDKVIGIQGFAEEADGEFINATPLTTITIKKAAHFLPGDIIGVRNLGRGNDGFYEIKAVRNNQLDVRTGITQTVQDIETGEGNGYLTRLRSVRSSNIQTANSIIEKDLSHNQKLWIDGTDNQWSVLQKKESFLDFNEYYTQDTESSIDNSYGNDIAASNENLNVAIANSKSNNGVVEVWQRPTYKSEFKLLDILKPDTDVAPMNDRQAFGESIALSPDGKLLVVGSPSASNISETFQGEWNANTNYSQLDMVSYQENFWRAVRNVPAAEVTLEYSTFDSYAFTEIAATNAGLSYINDITLLLQGQPYFANKTVDHILIRAPFDQYRASKVTDNIVLKWNKYTNLNRQIAEGEAIEVWPNGLNDLNDGVNVIPNSDFIDNGFSNNGKHEILEKIDYVLYLTAFNNPPSVGDTVITNEGAGTVASVFIEQDKLLLYIKDTNGVLIETDELRNGREDVIGQYTQPSFKPLSHLGGFWKVQTAEYINANEFSALTDFGTPAYGLVYQDLITSEDPREPNYYINSLDTVYPTNTDKYLAYISVLSHTGIEYNTSATNFFDTRWIVRLPKEIEAQTTVGTNVRLYIDKQNPSYDFSLVGLQDPGLIEQINSQTHEVQDMWDGWIDFIQIDRQPVGVDTDGDGQFQDFFEPIPGDIIEDAFTGATAEVAYYLNRDVNKARVYIKNKSANKIFSSGNSIVLNTLENGSPNQRRMGEIQNVSTFNSITGKLVVLNHPSGSNFPINPNSYGGLTQFSSLDVFAYANKEYWIYQETLTEEGRDLPASIPSILNNDWVIVYNAPVNNTGTINSIANQGVYTIYKRFDSQWSYVDTYSIPGSATGGVGQRVGQKVAIAQTNELYRIFVGSKDKVYLLKHGTDDDGVTYEYALDKDKRYRGAWSVTASYLINEIVVDNYQLYQARTFSTGSPTTSNKWQPLNNRINYLSHVPNDHPLYSNGSDPDALFDDLGETVIDFTKDLAVSKNGEVIAVSAETDTSVDEDNKILIYRLQDTRYVFHQEIVAPTSNTNWGSSIDLSTTGHVLVVGEPGNDEDGFDTGKAYIYTLDTAPHFTLKQTISGPGTELADQFGYAVSITDEYIGVSSFNGNIKVETRFDRYQDPISLNSYVLDEDSNERTPTTFDDGFTSFLSDHVNSGSVTLYQDIDGHWLQAEQLEYVGNSNVDGGSRFARSLLLNQNNVYIGLPTNPTVGPEATNPGSFLDYVMEKGTHAWTVLRNPVDVVDVKKIKHAFLYNVKTNQLVTYLDFVDPVQGKILGEVDQEISWKSYIDLARYNATNLPEFFSETNNWENKYVGQLWWDLSTARFKDAYHGDSITQANNWNTLVQDYSIDIYEWVESDLIPSEWDSISSSATGLERGISGLSKYGDDAYSVKLVYDKETSAFNEKYYFWVKDKFTLPTRENRSKTALDVSRLIADPRGQGYRYVTLLSNNKFALFNCESLISDKDIALNIGYYTSDSELKNIHFEYQILSEGLETSVPKADLERKWIHSLVGYDDRGREVPDMTLPQKQKYGTLFKPRQSWFVNRAEALKEVIERANIVLQENIVVDDFDLSILSRKEDVPLVTSRLYDRIVDTELDLQFLGTAKVETAILTPVIAENGTVRRVAIQNSGRGYNDLTFDPLTSANRAGPDYEVIGSGTGLELDIIINNLGQITKVNIINHGKNYDADTLIIVRPLSVLVQSDSTIDGRWAIYNYDNTDTVVPWKRKQVQSYDTSAYWDYANWYAEGYNQFTQIDFLVEESYQLYGLDDDINDIIKIKNIGSAGWLLLKKIGNSGNRDYTFDYETIGRENGTIQFSKKLYSKNTNFVGYDNYPFDGNFYDTEPVQETRDILTALKDNIFVDNLAVHYNKLFFASVRYVLSEQLNVDWVFKTSFVKAKHNVGELEQKITYQNDSLPSYNDYINEVKPYSTSVREYLSAYQKVDNTNTLVSDFDVPPYYNEDSKSIVPARVTVIDDELTVYDDRFDEYPDKNWKDNVGFKLTAVNIFDAGEGYTSTPTITFVGGGGTGAKARAYIGAGKIRSVEVVDPGTGYLSAPRIIVAGSIANGGREGSLNAVIGDTVVRSMHVDVKFDRVSGDYFVVDLPETQQFTGTGAKTKFDLKWPMDLRNNKIQVFVDDEKSLRNDYTYLNVDNTDISYTRQLGQIVFAKPPALDAVIRVEYFKDPAMLSAQDRIKHRYFPTEGMPGVDLGQLMSGVDYGGVEVRSFDFDGPAGWDTDEWYTSTWDTYDNTYEDQLFVADGSTTVIELDTPLENGIVYNIYKNGIRIDDADYPANPSNPNAVMPSLTGNGSQVLINLADYEVDGMPGDRFIVRKVSSDGSFLPDAASYDTQLIGGDFIGNASGVKAEDIVIDGDLFVTSNNSGGPEELVPGQVLDTVDLTVYERIGSGNGQIYNQTFITNEGDSTFNIGVTPSSDDAVIVKVNDEIINSSEYTLDYINLTITFNEAFVANNRLNIITVGVSGKDIISIDQLITDGTSIVYETAIPWTDILQIYTRYNGAVTKELEVISRESDNGFVEFLFNPNIPSAGNVLDYEIYSNREEQNYSRVVRDSYVASTLQKEFTLSQTPIYKDPQSFFTVVIIDNVVQRPGYQKVYIVEDDTLLNYSLETFQVPYSSIDITDVFVYLNGNKLTRNESFTVATGSSSINFLAGLLNEGDKIEIFLENGSYTIEGNQLVVEQDLYAGTKVQVMQFSNHDIIEIHRTSYDIEIPLTLVPGDETDRYNNLTAGKVLLNAPAIDAQYVWIAVSGQLLTPNVDYKLVTPLLIQLNNTLEKGQDIDIIHFAAPASTPTIAWKQFKDILNRTHYKRFDTAEGIYLTEPLQSNDLRVYVNSTVGLQNPNKKLNQPGVLWINKERIEYFAISGNTLRQLRRSTHGTGAGDIYDVGTPVYAMGINKNMPYRDEIVTTNYVAADQQKQFVLDFTPTRGVDEFEVFAAGKRLRKTEIKSFDPTVALDSPAGDITIPPEFTVVNSVLVLTTPLDEGQKIAVVRKIGKLWSETGTPLKDAENDIGRFLRKSISELPK